MSFGALGRGKSFGANDYQRFQIDYRIGGRVSGVLGGYKLTLFPDEIRKCVTFACIRTAANTVPVGTAFFTAVPLGEGQNVMYAVTAKHVVDWIKDNGADKSLYLRVNLRVGATFEVKTDVDDWFFHPSDKSVDVAVLPFGLPPKVRNMFDLLALPITICATKEIIAKEGIGIGDSVFLTGLFTRHSGTRKNVPIVRVGNIAAMPEEPVTLTGFGDADVYLVESRSIGGLSGSPVFVHLGIVRINAEGIPVVSTDNLGRRTSSGPFYLLGLMHGHYYEDMESDDDSMKDWKHESINLGIAIVVPAVKILEVINQPTLEEQRRTIAKQRQWTKPDSL